MKKVIYIILFLFTTGNCFSQERELILGPWHFTSLSGEINMESFYRDQKRTTLNYVDDQESFLLNGKIDLNTKSYIWHPDFMLLNINAGYSPEIGKRNYLIFPDRSEARTNSKLGLNAVFLNRKFITLSTFINFHDGTSNIDNISNVNFYSKTWGTSITTTNKKVPFILSYEQSKIKQNETFTGRLHNSDRIRLNGKIDKSFTEKDKSYLSYTYTDNKREDMGIYLNRNKVNHILLSNTYIFDAKKNYTFRSMISNNNHQGTTLNSNRVRFNESVTFRLPYRFTFRTIYDYSVFQVDSMNQKQQLINTELSHKLYRSLNSKLYTKVIKIDHSVYKENRTEAGIQFLYTKKIPKGRLNLSYQYQKTLRDNESQSSLINIINEQHSMTDGNFEMLDNAYIDINTVVVKDITGTIIYQLNFDYILIERDNYIEIQRIAGGQIANNSTITVDYIATQPGTYSYDENFNSFSASVRFFEGLIELYFRFNQKDYVNLKQSDFISLNYLTQKVYGISTSSKYVRAGFEFDDFNSSISPYKLHHYFLDGHITFNKFLFSLNGNVRNYQLLNDNVDQDYIDITGKASVSLSPKTKINLDIGYRNQQGQNLYLDLFTFRTEFEANMGLLYFKAGVELYNRKLTNDAFNFNGVFFEIARRF